MLIKLIPESTNPAVLFALSFANTPFAYSPDKPLASILDDISFETSLFMSPGWANQLNTLAVDDLDPPTALHALDRAAGIPTLLQEVTLDVPSNTIRCLFVDGSVEEWMWPANPQTPVPAEKRPRLPYDAVIVQHYLETLQSIIRDVTQSATEEERERQRELHLLQQEQEEHRRCSTEASAPTSNPPLKTHKKQRSFFMNIVASIVNLTPGSSTFSHPRLPPLKLTQPPKRSPSTVPLPPSPLSPTPPPTPTRHISSFPPLWSPPNSPMRQTLRQIMAPANTPRALRWRARSVLVDAFRRFVLPEILSRSAYGSYRNYHAINVDLSGPDGTGKVGAGYYVWTIESVLRRAGERMDDLAQIAAAAGAEVGRERDRRTRTKIFPRFSVPRRKANVSNQVTSNMHARHSVEEDRAQRERERREAEYFASTTQSVQSPHLFSDEEEDATDLGRPKSSLQRRDNDPTINGDEDTNSIETDTDGSSVHTPSSGHETFIFPPQSKSGSPNMPPPVPPKTTRGAGWVVPLTPVQAKPPSATLISECPPPGSLPPTEMAEYKSLSRLTGKLQYLLIGARARAAQAESEAKQREVVLEVRSRRRAWLNRSFGSVPLLTDVKGNGNTYYGYIATCTMSTPYMSSPLAKCMWTAEDWEYAPDLGLEVDDNVIFQERIRPCASDDVEQAGFGHQLRRLGSERGAKRGEPKLFPVTEEEEEELIPEQGDEEALMGNKMRDEDGLRELELGVAGLGLDLEAGEMAWIEDEGGGCKTNPGFVKTGIELDRPKVRKRTSSMYEQQSPFGRSQNQFSQTEQKMTLYDSSQPPGLTASSLLCQPLTSTPKDSQKLKPHIVFVPPAVDKALICESFVSEIKDSGEFTLSMDLPPPRVARSPPTAYGHLPVTSSLPILSPSPQSPKQLQFTIVPDAR